MDVSIIDNIQPVYVTLNLPPFIALKLQHLSCCLFVAQSNISDTKTLRKIN